MRRWIIGMLLALAALFLTGRSIISEHAKGYIQELLDSHNRVQSGQIYLKLASYRERWNSAEANIQIRTVRDSGKLEGFRNPLTLPFRIDYGPLFLPELQSGLIRLESRGSFSRWLDANTSRDFLKIVPKDISYHYQGILDWWHVMHEEITLSRIDAYFSDSRERLTLEPLKIRSNYLPKNLKGRTEVFSEKLILADEENGERLELLAPRLDVVIRDLNTGGPSFGTLAFSEKEVRLLLKGAHPQLLRFNGAFRLSLEREGARQATLSLKAEAKALNRESQKIWENLKEGYLHLRLESLGIEGLEKLIAMQQKRQTIQQELLRAVGIQDDIAMQKAILALQALDNNWIETFNTLFIPGKTRLVWDETLRGDRESRLHVDLTFTGEKLPKDPFSAMVTLTTGVDRMVEGNFDLLVTKRLLEKLSFQGKIILDSMVKKGLAGFQDGIYHLRGSIRGGKIIINGTRYSPQELIMLILM